MSAFLSIIILFGIIFWMAYQTAIPTIMQNQVQLRAESIAKLFATTVMDHFTVRDYIGVNNITNATAALPGVGYAVLINANGVVVAGDFGDINRFDTTLGDSFTKGGFPPQLASQIRLSPKELVNIRSLPVGGREILEYALRSVNSGAEVHVGMLADEFMQNVNEVFLPYLVAFLGIAIFGSIILFWLLRTTMSSITK